MGKSARAKFNMLSPSIKDEQLWNILSNKYLNSSAQARRGGEKKTQHKKKKHVAYPLITSVSRGSERQLFDANKQTRQTRWAHYRRVKSPIQGHQTPAHSSPSSPASLPLSHLSSHFSALPLPFTPPPPSLPCFSSHILLLFLDKYFFPTQKHRRSRKRGGGGGG